MARVVANKSAYEALASDKTARMDVADQQVNVLVPFVRLHPQLVAALATENVRGEFVETSGRDAYWRVLAEWWSRGESFIVLEQDKVPAPGVLNDLWVCSERWCTVRVAMRGVVEAAPYPSLSCTKFAAELLAAEPLLMRDVGELNLGFGEREWSRLDMGIAGLLEARGYVPHWHDGVVEHLHEDAA